MNRTFPYGLFPPTAGVFTGTDTLFFVFTVDMSIKALIYFLKI